MARDWRKQRDWLAAQGPRIAFEALVNFIGPYVIFSVLKPRLGDVHALMASSLPPILWSLVEFARRRRVDALSILVLAGIAASLLAYLGGGGVKFLQLREKLVTFAIGLVFLGSAVIRRPLIYYLALSTLGRRSAEEASSFSALNTNPYFRRTMTVMTLVWGVGLVGEALLSGALVFALPIKRYLIFSPILGYSVMGALWAWTFWYSRRQRAKGDARRAAEAALSKTAEPASA